MNSSILKLNDVSLHFGGLKAINNVSFEMNKGEILSLIGPNGAGKTSTFNIITGVYNVSCGDIIFKDQRINKLKPYQITAIGMARTFQNIRLFKQLTVLENILIAMHHTRKIDIFNSVIATMRYFKEQKQVTKVAYGYLEYFDLLKYADNLAENLPYGKQRELEICRAVATGADLLLLDEPAAGMNPTETDRLMLLIQKIRNERNTSIFLIEHDMKLVMGISDRVVVLDYGEKIAEGSPSVIRTNSRVIEAYLGKEVDDAKA